MSEKEPRPISNESIIGINAVSEIIKRDKKISQLEKELAIANEALEDMAIEIYRDGTCEICPILQCTNNNIKDCVKSILNHYKEKAKENLK